MRKLRSRIDPNMESKMECILASILKLFERCLEPSWGGKTDEEGQRAGKEAMREPPARQVRSSSAPRGEQYLMKKETFLEGNLYREITYSVTTENIQRGFQ